MTAPACFVVVVGGDPSLADWAGLVPAGSLVVAADSGVDAAIAAGIAVDHVVGDLDSVDPNALARAVADGAEVHRHPADKDETDGALALDLVRRLAGSADALEGRTSLLVLGGGGGRLDHLLADLLALAAPGLARFDVTARFGAATATVVQSGVPRTLAGSPGEQVSLLPVHGRVGGVTTRGLRWPLVEADLTAGTTRGVSNELLERRAEVAVAEGTLLVIQPGTRAGAVATRSTPYDPTPRDGRDRTGADG